MSAPPCPGEPTPRGSAAGSYRRSAGEGPLPNAPSPKISNTCSNYLLWFRVWPGLATSGRLLVGLAAEQSDDDFHASGSLVEPATHLGESSVHLLLKVPDRASVLDLGFA